MISYIDGWAEQRTDANAREESTHGLASLIGWELARPMREASACALALSPRSATRIRVRSRAIVLMCLIEESTNQQ